MVGEPEERSVERGGRYVPQRRCVATRTRAAKAALLRVVLGPDGCPFVDLLGRAPGRAAYVTPDPTALAEMLSVKGAGRAFKGAAVPLSAEQAEAAVEDTRVRLEERILELVGLARRAGKLAIGMDDVLAHAGEPGLVVVAAKDLSERSEAKVTELGAPVVRAGTKVTLGARIGRDETGILGLRPSVFAERAVWEAERLAGLSSTSTKAVSRGRVRSARKRKHD